MSAAHEARDRVAAAFVLALLVAGCLVLWIGIPIASMWGAAQVTDDAAGHFLAALGTVVVGMVVWGRVLFWLNRLYLRIRWGPGAVTPAEDDPEDEPRWVRGPLEPLLVGTLVLALVSLFAWFFLLAENPSIQVI